MGWRLSGFECSEIGRLAGKTIGYIWKNHATVNRCRTWLEPEVQIGGIVKLLDIPQILRVQPGDIHEDVVIQNDAVQILFRGLAVFRERTEPPGFQTRAA